MFETFGDATPDTRYVVYSATKAFVAGAMWALIGDGLVDVQARVDDYVPGFGTNGKDVITVEQVMLHTSGFPLAPMPPLEGATSDGPVRAVRGVAAQLGTRHQVPVPPDVRALGARRDHRAGDRRRLPRRRRTARHRSGRSARRCSATSAGPAAELMLVGEEATPDELEAVFGVRELDVGEVTDDALVGFNDPAVQRVGIPGGGGVMRACDLAMYYQAVLHNPGEMWRPDVIDDVRIERPQQPPRCDDRAAGEPHPRTRPGGQRRTCAPARNGPHGVAGDHRPQRRQGTDRVR